MKFEKVRRYPYDIDWRKIAPPVRKWDDKAKTQFDRAISRDPPKKESQGSAPK